MKYRIASILGVLFLDNCCALYRNPSGNFHDNIRVDSFQNSFQTPDVRFRPRLRYWIPDAHVDLNQIYDDIAEAGARGAAGVEVLGFYLYGASPGTYVPTDWNTYGWGTPAWKNVLDTAITAHINHGLIMDFAMGPNQGQGVPADEDDEGLMWDLVPSYAFVPLGGSFNDTVPGWGTGVLQSVVTGLITKTTTASVKAAFFLDGKPHSGTQHTLLESSLEDVTQKVTSDGWLKKNFPENSSGLENLVYAVYLVRSGARNQEPPAELSGPQTIPTDAVHNGSWIVDHFSARGAKVMTDFWEKHLLTNGTKEKLTQVARCAWEDSIEINPNIYWTPTLPELFEKRRGYSINKYYPILFHENSLLDHFDIWFVTDETDSGNSHVDDYRTTLTEGYGEYLDALRAWSNEYLNVNWSSQIGYNMAVDMQSVISKADIPECEDLAFGGNIDAYRQFSAPANMAGKQVISAEVGAVLGKAYQLTIPSFLQPIKRLFAGGVNALVLHGYPYSGEYPNTTWPCYATFTYSWSDMLGRHQPAWDFMRGPFDYLSRTMYFLQSGVAKMDVAFYQKRTSYAQATTTYEPDDLFNAGYAYGYLNPDTLALADATVQDGILAPDMQAYKALIVRGNDTMTVQGADMIAKHARDGLPLVFSGGIPSYLGSYDPSGSAHVNETLQSLRNLTNVHEVPYVGLRGVIASLGIEPRTKINATSSWWPVWRETDEEQYVFIYNAGDQSSSGTVEFQSTGKPYRYDAWSGDITPIGIYTQRTATTIIQLFLEPHQTALIVFKNHEENTIHAVATSPGILDVRLSANNPHAVVGYDDSSDTQWVLMSDGVKHKVGAVSAKPFDLQNWTLVVEHWDPPTPLTNISVVASRWNSTHHLDSLTSWQDINGLHNVSGRGYYEAAFAWPPTDDADGAIISFGEVIHTLSASVNGNALSELDVTEARTDITPFLVKGHNEVQVIVSTTMANGLAPIWDNLLTSGAPPTGLFGSNTTPPGDADYGLVGPVTVIPYREFALQHDVLVKQLNSY